MSKLQFQIWYDKSKDIEGFMDLLEQFGCHMIDHQVGKGKYDQMTFAVKPLDILSSAKKATDETLEIPAMSVKVDMQHNLLIIDGKE